LTQHSLSFVAFYFAFKISKFVTMVCQYDDWLSGHYPSSYLKQRSGDWKVFKKSIIAFSFFFSARRYRLFFLLFLLLSAVFPQSSAYKLTRLHFNGTIPSDTLKHLSHDDRI
jgi:hypothetical protein